MVRISSFALASVITGVFAAPTTPAHPFSNLARRSTPSSTGTSNGFYYSFYTDGIDDVTYTNGDAGEYTLTWSGDGLSGDVVGGKGWETGSARDITYTADYQPDGNSYLSVYGWTTSPLVEYYILESYGTYNPASSLTLKGTVTSDGSIYDIYEGTRTNAPSISGTATFQQYWSIRRSKRTSGTVTTKNHFDEWSTLGLGLGAFDYQIVATEGYDSSGTSTVTVSGP